MASWLREDKEDIGAKIILFLISPVFSFFYSLRRIKTKSSFVFFFLFSVFFGLAFTVGKIRYQGTGDGVSYRIFFENTRGITYSRFVDGFKSFLSFNRGEQDYYFDTVSFFLSRVTTNYHVMFMVFAIIFAFFQLKSFRFLTSENKFNNSLSCLILALLFTWNQIFNINGVRFWTAAWVGVYAIFQIFRNGNKRYLLLVIFTPFFHASFWIFVPIILLAFFSKRFEKVWIILFFASFIFSSITLQVINDTTSSLPPFLQNLTRSYTSAENLEKFRSAGTGLAWVAKLFNYLILIYINLLVYLFIRNSNDISRNLVSKSMYNFLLVFITFVNFAMPIPSLGVRFIVLAYPIVAYVWLINFEGRKYKWVLYAMPFVFSFSIYTLINQYLDVLPAEFYVSSPFYLIYRYLVF